VIAPFYCFFRCRISSHCLYSLAFVVAQENAKDLYKHMTPLLQKCMLVKRTTTGMMSPSSSVQQNHRRAGQQADNLVWQQEAFHKVLKLQALLKEGLISEAELQTCRKDILAVVAAVHQDGEWANFTRDKLLFLQVCFCCSCLQCNSAMTVKMTERLGFWFLVMTDREKNQGPIEEPNHPSSIILFFQQYPSQLLLLSLC
jgi:hypothetical protein